MPEHTPGPWTIEGEYVVAYPGRDGVGVVVADVDGRTPEELRSNQFLIAAAPRMFGYIEARSKEGDLEARAILLEASEGPP